MTMTPNTQEDAVSAPPPVKGELAPHGLARRRFARVGAGATGVLMTLSSPSGMAQVACVSSSAAASHAVAYTHAPEAAATCDGKSPGFYKNNPDQWPAMIPSNTTLKFGDVFAVNANYAQLGSMTLMQVFEVGNGGGNGGGKDKGKGGTAPLINLDPDPENVGSHFLAAYLNLKSDRADVLDEATLKRMWREYMDTGGGHIGYYQPSAKVKWYGKDLVHYLTTVTFHNPAPK